MKNMWVWLIVWMLWSCGAFLHGQEANNEFALHIENIVKALTSFENDVRSLQQSCVRQQTALEDLQKKYAASNSWLEKTKIKIELELAKHKIVTTRNDLAKQERQLCVYYCLLDVWQRRTMSGTELAKAREQLSNMERWQADIGKKTKAAQERAAKAQKRLQIIPGEITKAETQIANMTKQLQVLEDKKTWGNLAERLEFKAKLSFQQSNVLKLKGEIILLEKVRDDSFHEEKSLKIENQELETAIKRLRGGKSIPKNIEKKEQESDDEEESED